jgi:hypothetical protein
VPDYTVINRRVKGLAIDILSGGHYIVIDSTGLIK